MNLRHLYVFREVARLNSISAAARSVHLSQPALTQAIASIERQFGAQLFSRRGTGVALTPAGQLCFERVQRALIQLREAMVELARGSSHLPTEMDIGRHITAAQLDALAAVVQHKNFSTAARARGLSQPTIHRATRELERSLGVPLFEKTSFGVVPTREAERLARRAKLAFAEIEQAQAEIVAVNGGESGRTVIGAMPLARTYLVPSTLIDFTTQFPQHRVAIVEGTFEYLLGALRSGEADFLVGAMRDPSLLNDVKQEHLFDDPLAIVVRAGHPLAKKKRVTPTALMKYSWIAPRVGSPLRTHFNNLFAAAGIEPPSAAIECNSLSAARAMLLESDRIMLLSAHQIYYELKAGLLMALPHPGGRVVRPIGLTYRHDWHPTTSQQHLLELLRQRTKVS